MPVIASPDLSRRLFLASTAAACLAAVRPAQAAGTIKPDAKSALIVVDVQNCFVDGGTLPVKGGAQVVPVINKLAASFENIVVTQDWHTPGHASFASTHAGKKPFETTQAALRHAGAVARPLRAGLRRRGAAQGSQAADGAAHHPQGLPQGRRQLFGLRGGRPQDRDRAWPATSRRAASRPCS